MPPSLQAHLAHEGRPLSEQSAVIPRPETEMQVLVKPRLLRGEKCFWHPVCTQVPERPEPS